MEKKIFFISHGLNIGGAEKFLISLANGLSENFDVTVIAISPGNTLLNELSEKVNFIQIERKRKIDFNTIFKLNQILKNNSNAIICSMDFFCFTYFRISTLFLKKQKSYISYHSTILKNKKEYFLTWLYTRFLRKTDKILTVSKNQAAYTSKKFKINPKKFLTINNGIEIKKWGNISNFDFKKIIRSNYNIPLDAKVIVITAALRIEKNHINAIKALDYLHNTLNCNAYLLLVGGGDCFNLIEKQVLESKLEQFVVFVGSQKDVRPFYYASDIFTLTSDRIETFSIAALEAMACGIPCVLTNIGGANEMIVPYENGFISEIAFDSIANYWYMALNTSFSKQKIISRVADEFNIEKMINNYKKIFS